MLVPGTADDLWLVADPLSATASGASSHPPLFNDFKHTMALASLAVAISLTLSTTALLVAFLMQYRSLVLFFCSVLIAVPLPWWAPWVWFETTPTFVPALVLSIPTFSFWTLWFGREIFATLHSPLINSRAQYGLAKGYSRWRLFWRVGVATHWRRLLGHVLFSWGHLLGGSVVIETTFNRRGLGTRLLESLHQRDHAVFVDALWCVLVCGLGAGILGRALQNTPTGHREWSGL